jgi:hypothetical protein
MTGGGCPDVDQMQGGPHLPLLTSSPMGCWAAICGADNTDNTAAPRRATTARAWVIKGPDRPRPSAFFGGDSEQRRATPPGAGWCH